MVLAKKAYKEGDYYLSIMNLKEAPALALHYALLLKCFFQPFCDL